MHRSAAFAAKRLWQPYWLIASLHVWCMGQNWCACRGAWPDGPGWSCFMSLLCSAGQPADLGMHVILVHGDEVIADSEKAGSIQAATAQYKDWLNKTFPSN